MLFKAPESKSTVPESRYDDNVEIIRTIVNNLLDGTSDSVTVMKVIRIVKLNTDDGDASCRPMKIQLKSEAEAKLLLAKAYKLMGQNLSLRPDLSKEDRQKRKELVEQLKQRTTNGERDLVIRDFCIIKRSLRKAPVILRATAVG